MSGSRQRLSERDVETLRRALVRAVARVCPAELADRRDDLVQASLLRLADRWRPAGGEGKDGLSSFYLVKVAYSTLIDELRCLRRRREVPLEDGSAAMSLPASEPLPDATAQGHEIGRAIHVCLGELGRPRRLAVMLYLQGHSVRQAAALLGWTYKRTENLVYRGLANLRDCLSARGLSP